MTKRKSNNEKIVVDSISKQQPVYSKHFWIVLALIVVITYIVYLPSLKNGFTNWDDNVYVAENNLIKSTSTHNIVQIFKFESIVSNNYHPLTILSLAMDYAKNGYNPYTYHFTNLLFHLFNTALVFWFVFLLTNKRIVAAGFVAFFFALHPMHVESVAWIAERKDVLYVFFLMASLVAYYKYVQATSVNKTILLYSISFVLFYLSILSKAMAVVLPLLLLLVDYYIDRAFTKKLLFEKIPFFLLSVFYGMLASKVQQGAIADIDTFTWLQRLSFASYGLVNYLLKLILPINLSCFYPYPNLINGHLPIVFYIVPFIALLFIGFIIYSFKNNKTFAFGASFFIISLALVLQFISVGQVIMADRYSYLAYIGILFSIGVGFDSFLYNENNRFKLIKKIAIPVVIVLGIVSIKLTSERINVWKNSDTLWSDAIKKYPSSESFRNRGSYLVNKVAYDKGAKKVSENEFDRALQDFTISIKMNPNNAKVYINRANIYGLKQRFDLALNDYSKAIELDKTDYQTFFNRGITYSLMKQFKNAASDYTTTLQMKPDFIDAKRNRAYVYADDGNFEQAIQELNQLIKLEPQYADYYFYRGYSYYKTGNLKLALVDNSDAIKLKPNYAAAYFNRSIINKELNNFTDAKNDAIQAQQFGYTVDKSYINELVKLAK
ncbi:MAG: tetratricopeptide repeat protein [Bacteroidia bacterium]